MSLANLVPNGVSPSAEHSDVLLELAYLATAADGRLADEELAAFTDIVGRLRGKPASQAEVDALLDRFGGNIEHAEITERVEKIAPTLPTDLRPIAFKLAVGLSVADLDASRDEGDLQVTLANALGLDEAVAEELIAEVFASLDAGEDL
ncbi:MAG TPA: hypothetical protein VM580_24165 [Labilithrix sp.]|jgi:hypothetical protein|nr:hypothetical protein [Labilithrix sp.]